MNGEIIGKGSGEADESARDDWGAVARRRPSGWAKSGLELDGCFEPESVSAMSEVLKEARARDAALLIVGGGTRLGLANPAREIRFGLSTSGLDGVDVFEPDEGVVHVRAGTRVRSVQQIVGDAGWELPIDPPGETSTVGGTIASAATGPRAQILGRVADAILGLEVLTSEGVETKCGGRVVKNVTGYDLAKLYCGSFGTLGVVTGAWLRLRPLPEKRLAFVSERPTTAEGFELARSFARRRTVRALVYRDTDRDGLAPGLYCELGGGAAEVEHDARDWLALFSGAEAAVTSIDALRDARVSGQASTTDAIDDVMLRARVLGSDLLALVERIRSVGLDFDCDPGLGVVHARGVIGSSADLLGLRSFAEAKGGLLSFEFLPARFRAEVDTFGGDVRTDDLMRQLKTSFDPSGLFGPGRFKAGI